MDQIEYWKAISQSSLGLRNQENKASIIETDHDSRRNSRIQLAP
jgi:hypothetical protein